MEFHVEWADIDEYVRSRQQPVCVAKRGVFLYQVPHGSWMEPHGVQWTPVETGDYVRIPMWAYKLPLPAVAAREQVLAVVFSLGLQIGMRAAAACPVLPAHRVILYLSRDCHDLSPEDAVRCYIGMAFGRRG